VSGQVAARQVRVVQFGSAEFGSRPSGALAEQVQAWHGRIGPPDNELPGAIPFHTVLAKTDDLVIAIVGADAYSTGMSIRIATRLRRLDASLHGFDVPPYGPGGGTLLTGAAYPDGRPAAP